MQVLIIPELFEPTKNWQGVKSRLQTAGVFTTVYDYKPPRTEDVSEIVEDITHHLVDATVVVGYGIGGRIAIQLASHKPHQLAALLLISTPAMPAPGMKSFARRLFRRITTPVRILIPFFIRKKFVELYKRWYPVSPEKLLYRSIIADDQEAFLNRITAPLHLLWGSNDKKVRPAVAEVMSNVLSYSDIGHDVEIIAGGNSTLHLSQPELVAKIILSITER